MRGVMCVAAGKQKNSGERTRETSQLMLAIETQPPIRCAELGAYVGESVKTEKPMCQQT